MKYKLLIVLVLFSLIANGQNPLNPTSLSAKSFIEVTGTASKEVVPDKIFISITLTNKIIDKRQYTIQAQEEKLKKALVANNISLDFLALSDVHSGVLTQRKREIGYEVRKVFILQLATADQVSRIAKELQGIDIKEAAIVKLEYSKIDSLRKVVRIAAIKAAKGKAEYLLQAVGEQLDKPIEIREVSDEPYDGSNIVSNTTMLNKNTAKLEDNMSGISYEKINIIFSYYIKYGIK